MTYTCRMCNIEIPKRSKPGGYPKHCEECRSLTTNCQTCKKEISIWRADGYPIARFCSKRCSATKQYEDPDQREIRRNGPSIKAIKQVQQTQEWKEKMSTSTQKRMYEKIANGTHPFRELYETKISKVEKSCIPVLEELGYWHSSFQFRVNHPNGTVKSPDFKKHGEQKVVEIFGRYWHPEEDEENVKMWYKEAGYDCIVIWEDQVTSIKEIIAGQRTWSLRKRKKVRKCI